MKPPCGGSDTCAKVVKGTVKKYIFGAVAVLLVIVGAREIHVLTHHQPSAAQTMAAHPMPTLFPRGELAPYTAGIDRQAAEATRLMQGWWSANGTKPQDKKFAGWLKGAIPAPPSASARAAELKQLQDLAKTRTPAGTRAGKWMQMYGDKALWLSFEAKQGAHLSAAQKNARRREITKVLKMAKRDGRQLSKELAQPAPFVTDPSLRADHNATSGKHKKKHANKVCPCSYPGGIAASGAAARTVMTYFYPSNAALYRHMDEELAFAQIYLGYQLPSDVDAGTLVGDMVGEYLLVTRHEGSPQKVAAAIAAGGSTPARSTGAAGSSGGSSASRG